MQASFRAFPVLPAFAALLLLFATTARPSPPDSARHSGHRGYRAFQPKPGEAADEPSSQLVQVLLDRQAQGDSESYMVQALFRGMPPERKVRVRDDRIEIDFLDTGKPAVRMARIRGGAIEASLLEEFYYREAAPNAAGGANPRIKSLVRLTLYMKAKPDLSFRNTLDRTLIHFRLKKPSSI